MVAGSARRGEIVVSDGTRGCRRMARGGRRSSPRRALAAIQFPTLLNGRPFAEISQFSPRQWNPSVCCLQELLVVSRGSDHMSQETINNLKEDKPWSDTDIFHLGR